MRDKQVSSVLVIDDKDVYLIGLLRTDLSEKCVSAIGADKELLAIQIMSSPLISINADSSPSYAGSNVKE